MAKVWRLLPLALAAFAVVGFAGTVQAQTFVTSGSGNVVGTYPNFTINGNNSSTGNTDYQATFASATAVTFTWTYHTADILPSFDPASYLVDGTPTQLTDNFGSNDQSGTVTVNLTAGQSFGWRVRSDGCCGTASLTISATVPASGGSSAGQTAQNFVAGRQQIITDALNFPDTFNRGSNGVQVQSDGDGAVDGLAFSASTATKLTPAEEALTRATVDWNNGKKQTAAENAGINFWIDGRIGLHATGSDVGKFAVTTLGVDKMVNSSVLLGFAVEGDWVTMPSGADGITGLGFMAGPYASIALSDNLALSAHVLAGRSWNDQTNTQGGTTYAGSFMTNRVDVGASLSGEFTKDLLTVRPDVSVSLIDEGAGDYVLSGGGSSLAIPGFNVATLEASAGSSFEYRLDTGNGVVFVPNASLKLGLDTFSTSALFGQGSLGLGIETEGGLRVDVAIQSRAATDGLKSVSATATVGGHL